MALRKRGDVIAKKATTIAIVNQKGGTAKTTTCENLGIGLAMEGKKVLLVDVDPQGSLTISMGWQQPDELSTTLSTLMQKAMNDQPIQPGDGILHHAEGVDLIPANIELAGMEVALVNSMNREKMLKQVLDSAKREYDYILLDCTPSLGMLTINALAAADTTLIPMQAQYLSAKGLEQLLQTIGKVRRQINPKLKIEGILLTMTDSRTIYGQQISISGHRRQYAARLAGLETLPVIVRDMDDDAATILMVDSNLQREHISPSERAFAYKMKMDAMKRTAGRPPKENPRQVVGNFETADLIGKESGESGRQVQRFIRLTNLIPELLDMVDEKKVSFNPAVELSYLSHEQQQEVINAMDDTQNAPSFSQAKRIKKLAQEGNFTSEAVVDIMGEEKKSEQDTVTIKNETLRKYFPRSYTPRQMEEKIIQLLDAWQKKRQRDNER